jgi:isopenicillin N synthase-like dioxygenase
LTEISIPFFFEPNFDAKVAPLEAARRIQDDLSRTTERHHTSEQITKIYEPTIYGNFLLTKVRNNFANGGGKYN